MNTDETTVSRRKFLRTGAIGAGAAAGALAAPAIVTAQSPIVLKMQSSWPSSDIFQDMAKQYVDRVEAMSGGRLRIDLLPAGAVVGAFQVQDACHDGIIDAAHSVPVYWYGKHKAASLFGTGPVWGGSASNLLAWIHQGGGKEFYRELTQGYPRPQCRRPLRLPDAGPAVRLFKRPINTVGDVNGLKYRTAGLAADLMQATGMRVTQLPGGEIVPAMERGVIDAFEFNNPTSARRRIRLLGSLR